MKETKDSKPCCGDGCDCGKPVVKKTFKVIVCLVVLLIVVGIVACRLLQVRPNAGGDCCEPKSSSCCPEN